MISFSSEFAQPATYLIRPTTASARSSPELVSEEQEETLYPGRGRGALIPCSHISVLSNLYLLVPLRPGKSLLPGLSTRAVVAEGQFYENPP